MLSMIGHITIQNDKFASSATFRMLNFDAGDAGGFQCCVSKQQEREQSGAGCGGHSNAA